MRHIFLVILSWCMFGHLQAQDQLELTTGELKAAWLVEVNEKEILYYAQENQQGPLLRIPTQRVRMIRFKDGGNQSLQPWTGQELPRAQTGLKNLLAWDLLSVGFGYVGLSYQRVLSPRIRVEVHAALLGLTSDPNYREPYSWFRSLQADINGVTIPYTAYRSEEYEPSEGFFLKVGPKLHLGNPEKALQGPYFQPQLLLTRYQRSQRIRGGNNHPDPLARQDPLDIRSDFQYTHAGLATNLGYQHLFFDRLSFDIYLGLGLAVSNWQEEETNLLTGEAITVPTEEVWPRYVFRYNHIGFDAFGGLSPVIFNFGLQMGWAF